MASASSPSLSLFRASKRHGLSPPGRSRRARILASDTSEDAPPSPRRKGTPGVDTRIHWSSPDEGWVGRKSRPDTATEKNENLGGRFADLISASTTSHYQLSTPSPPPPLPEQFLGVPADADMEVIKAAYRRLSKEYHPDTTMLPLKTASQKFVQLREAYIVLSDEESRRFYDWTLAQEAESRRAERMRMKLEDPYMQEVSNWESIPDTVDRLGGKNMKLSDQAMTALTIDIFIILFSVCCIVFVVFFKEPY
ncbi:hypothetical protein Taro_016160 [Colocasia esculenta]|uniref:J domain-containing protein n=1 Tax=Colocasia esculenta TaxID=4460 RepID=A0A843US52_COLES|nr:hypothetical protein [Colocasia esculenta]